MNNNWNQQPIPDQPAGNNNPPRSGLLRDYRQQQADQNYPSAQSLMQRPYGPPAQPYQEAPMGTPYNNAVPQYQAGPVSPPPVNRSGVLPYGQPGNSPNLAPPSGNLAPAPSPYRQPQPLQQPAPSAQPQNWFASQVERVRSWSGKMASVYAQKYEPAAPPMVLYRPSAPLVDEAQSGRRPWKRSLALRLTMQRRHRRRTSRLRNGITPMRIGSYVAIAILLLIVVVASSGSAYAYNYYERQQPELQNIANQQITQTTHIYDRNMMPIFDAYDVNGGRRTPVTYNQIPEIMRDAMVDTEDHTFWTNSGVDPQGILRNIPSYLSGHADGGGSGITQQLVKNLRDDATYSINRKISEAALAIGMTQEFPKTKILEMYFNVAPFGTLDLGVEAAAEDYFGLKPQCDMNFNCTPGISQINYNPQTKKDDPILGLARASFLAGMPQNPTEYDPTVSQANLQRALARQQVVLNAMINYNVSVGGEQITPQMAQQAEAISAKWKFQPYVHFKKDPHFVDWIVTQLEQDLGVTTFLTGGFNVRTTIDTNLEQYVENAVHRHLDEPDLQLFPYEHYAVLNQDDNVNDAAVVVLNAKTGEILAMDGSADYYSTDPRVGGEVNAAVSGRPPGSTFKPFVYTTAFEMGWYPGMVLPDVQTYFPNGASAGTPSSALYKPTDYGATYSNRMTTIRLATADSDNVPAVKALQFAGIDNVLTNVRRMGITSLDAQLQSKQCQGDTVFQCLGISMVLGSNNTSLLEMTSAYQTFADQGVHVPPTGILDIWDSYGHHLFHYDTANPQQTRVFSPQAAYMMTAVLSDEHARASEFLNDHDLSFWDWDPTCQIARAPYPDCLNHQVAAKTGTTDGFKDNWTIGYTPNVVVGVWAGNANDENMGTNVVGITGAAPIWHSIMEFVSGRPCADIDPAIACTPLDKSMNLNQPATFPAPPPGIHVATTSAINGLKGAGTQDWMWDNLDPQVSGLPAVMNNNNNNNNGDNNGNNGSNNNNNDNGGNGNNNNNNNNSNGGNNNNNNNNNGN
jgi:membrane peptidoglycan carboxypeptidase